MGILRLFLAFIVVITHSSGGPGLEVIGGAEAVRVFFIISGFYMALILSEKYLGARGPGLRLFYSNRALRIMPLLWVALAGELVVAGIMHHMGALPPNHWLSLAEHLKQNDRLPLLATYALTQVSGLGVDVMHVFSLGPDGAAHFYSGPVSGGEIRAWEVYPLAHAWTVSCELVFYLLAPALNGLRTRALVFWMILGPVAVFAAAQVLGQPLASVASSFMAPFQLSFFILGMVSYRFYRCRLPAGGAAARVVCLLMVACFGAILLFYQKLPPFSHMGSQACLYGGAALVVPVLFQWSKSLRWDRVLGELSYPVYLVHFTVIRVLESPEVRAVFGSEFYGMLGYPLVAMSGAVLVAWVLMVAFDRRMNEWRQRRAASAGLPRL